MSAHDLPEAVHVTEVGPRDGLQSEPVFIPTERKIALIQSMVDAGVKRFEVSSFVSPRAVPQLRDAAEVIAPFAGRDDLFLTALVPNMKGAERAAETGVNGLVLFASASQSHNAKNVNRTREQSIAGFAEIARFMEGTGIEVEGAIATAFGCPFEGVVPVEDVVDMAKGYYDIGMRHVTLGDTTGMATPALVIERVQALNAALPDLEIALHFHNTRGVGLVCAYTGLQQGIVHFESSIAGLGGCPFVPRATGNICTEDLVYMLEETGVATGIDLEKLILSAQLAEELVGRELPGQIMKAGPRLRTASLSAAPTANG